MIRYEVEPGCKTADRNLFKLRNKRKTSKISFVLHATESFQMLQFLPGALHQLLSVKYGLLGTKITLLADYNEHSNDISLYIAENDNVIKVTKADLAKSFVFEIDHDTEEVRIIDEFDNVLVVVSVKLVGRWFMIRGMKLRSKALFSIALYISSKIIKR